MSEELAKIARDFSAHRFAETYEFIAPQARWIAVGQITIEGREAIIAACEATAGHVREMTTEFTRFVTIAGDDAVAVDVVGRYTDAAGATSVVSSCDIYEFAAGHIVLITSYTVEIDG